MASPGEPLYDGPLYDGPLYDAPIFERRQRGLKCGLCNYRVLSRTSLNKHFDDSHQYPPTYEPGTCPYCGWMLPGHPYFATRELQQVYRHVLLCHPQIVDDDECEELRGDVVAHFSHLPYQCAQCFFAAGSANAITSHNALYHENPTVAEHTANGQENAWDNADTNVESPAAGQPQTAMGANSSQSVPKTQREWSQSAIFLLGAMTGARAIRDPEFPNFINDSFDVVKLENILQRLGHGDPDDYDHQLLECTAGLGFRLPAVNNTQGSNGVTTAQHNNVQRPPGQPDNAATPAIQSSSSVETSEDVIAQMEACTASAAYREQYNETSARR